jgi:Zn-finger nucleic acid-binding protein
MAFVGSKFCPHCGKALVWPADVDATLRCPRCGVAGTMATVTLSDTQLVECRKCCGVWLPVATFEQICRSQERQEGALAALNLGPAREAVGADSQSAERLYLPCPKCGTLMNRVNFAHRSGVIVDVCRTDGVWFDRDELRRIIEFIRAGGLERSRERDVAELDSRLAEIRAEAAASQAARSALSEADGDAVGDLFGLLGRCVGSLFK